MDIKKEIVVSLGRYALQSMTHRHVFATPSLKVFATTKSIGPFHSHKLYIGGKTIETDVSRSGQQHRHQIVINGRKLTSGLPVEGPSTDFF